MNVAGTTRERHHPGLVYRTSVWSTRVDLVVTDPGSLVSAAAVLHQELDRVDRVASRFRPDSELNALHAATRTEPTAEVSPDLFDALAVARRAAVLSGGAVDPTVGSAIERLGYDRDFPLVAGGVAGSLPEAAAVPGWRSVTLDADHGTVTVTPGTRFDLGATAKAWAADRAAVAIAGRTGGGVLVSLGGDVAVVRAPPGGFDVGIADICGDPDAPVTVSLASGGLATSGIGNRYWTLGGRPVHHLIDPATGLPVEAAWRTVTVAAGSCVDANTASTAAMVLGTPAPAWLAERRLPARLVAPGGQVTAVAGWPAEPAVPTRTLDAPPDRR